MPLTSAALAALILAVDAACVVFVAARVSGRVCEDDDGWLLRTVVGVLVGLCTAVGILTALGTVDLLSRFPVVAAHVAVAAAVYRWVEHRPVPGFPSVSPPAAAVAAAGAFVAALSAALGLTGGPSTEPDTVQYHAPNAGAWLTAHNLWKLPITVPGYFTNVYPSNGELSALWVMVASHGDQLAYVVNVAFGLLAVVSVALIVQRLGAPAWSGGLAALAVAGTPLAFQTQTHSMMTDVAAAAGIAAGVALVLVAADRTDRARWTVLAGLAFGLAAGSKDTAVAPAIGGLVLLAWLVPRGRRVRAVGLAAAGILALAGFWWIRTAVATGNPIFPQAIAIGSRVVLRGGTSPLDVLRTPMLDHFVHGRTGIIRQWVHDGRVLIGPGAVVLVLAVAAAGVAWVRRPRPQALLLVGGLVGACALAYLATPYTGGGKQGVAFLVASQWRYALPTLFLAAAVAAAALPRLTAVGAALTLLWDLSKDARPPTFRTDIHPHASLILAALLVSVAVVAVAVRPAPRAVVTAGLTLAGMGAAVVVLHRPIGGGATRFEALLPPPDRARGSVLVLSAGDVRSLMGPRFERAVVAPSERGGRSPAMTPAQLELVVRQLHPAAVVVPATPSIAFPTRWAPPGYARVGLVTDGVVYAVPSP